MTDKEQADRTGRTPGPGEAAKASYKINMTLTRKGRNRLIWLGLIIICMILVCLANTKKNRFVAK